MIFFFWCVCDGIVMCRYLAGRSSSFVINIYRGANRYIRTSLPSGDFNRRNSLEALYAAGFKDMDSSFGTFVAKDVRI